MGIKYFIVFQNEDPSDYSVGFVFVFQTRQIQFAFNISDELISFFLLYIISLCATGNTEQTSATFYSGSVGHRIIVSAYKMLKADMKHK